MDLKQADATSKKWAVRLTIGGSLIFVVGLVAYTLVSLNFSYGKGERVGFVQNISKKG